MRELASGHDRIIWPDPDSDPVGSLGVSLSFPDWLTERWIRRFGLERASEIMKASNRPAPLWVRTNTLRVRPDQLSSLLSASGHQVQPSKLVPGAAMLLDVGDVSSLPAHQDGWFHVQDAAAQAVCHLLDLEPGQRVLDACGAPGGKTATMAQMLSDQGEIVSADIHPARLGLVRRITDRLGLQCVSTRVVDLTAPQAAELGLFDRILLDAPCSGLGVLRRHPESKWRTSPEDLTRLSSVQRQLLDSVAALLKPGGVMVYSVCTPTEEEGAGQIQRFLSDHPDLEPSSPGKEGVRSLHAFLDGQGSFSSWPDLHNMDSFFAARMTRKE